MATVAQIYKFESDVILYGGQTKTSRATIQRRFESDVILYGGQTIAPINGHRNRV